MFLYLSYIVSNFSVVKVIVDSWLLRHPIFSLRTASFNSACCIREKTMRRVAYAICYLGYFLPHPMYKNCI